MIEIITPLIQQHSRDAAFYWSQIDSSRFTTITRQEKLYHFHRQLNAHLDGLRAAGDTGWNAALKNLNRWKTEGETFVCWLLAFEAQGNTRFETIWPLVRKHQDTTLRGAIGAMVCLPYQQAALFLNHWLNSTDELLIEITLRSFAARRIAPDKDLTPYFGHTNARIRIACCQLVGKLRLQPYRYHIESALSDANVQVREQAALAYVWLLPKADIANTLFDLIVYQLQNAPRRGLASVLAQRRMELLSRMLGHATPCGDKRLTQYLAVLPERLRLLMLAHHGDPAQLPLAFSALENEKTARLAFWAIGLITGLDISDPDLCAPAPEVEEDEKPLSITSDDADIGLEWPNVPAVIAACQSLTLPAGPLLLGQTASISQCQEVLATAVSIIV